MQVDFREMDREVARVLHRLEFKDARRVMQAALRAEGTKLLRELKKEVPRDTGLAAGVKKKGSGLWLAAVKLPDRENVAEIAIGYRGGARYYAHLMERGTRFAAGRPVLVALAQNPGRLKRFAVAVVHRVFAEYRKELKKGKIR